jgi:hypothetical protein
MPSARFVNVIACRTYAVLFGGLTALYLLTTALFFWWAKFGPPQILAGQMARQGQGLGTHILYGVAVFCLICAVVSAVLAIFTWMRYVAALCVAFLLWAGVAAPGVLSKGGGIAAHPVAVLLTAALALLLVAALATRRRANTVEFDRGCFD